MAEDCFHRSKRPGRLAILAISLGFANPPIEVYARRAVPRPPGYARLVDRVIALDSTGWVIKTYQRGSVRDVQVRRGELPGNIIVVATYGYESGARATATVVVHKGRVQCVQYSNDPWSCHPVGNNPGLDLYAAVAETPEEREREEQAKAHAKEQECLFDPRYC